jgi:hypothetical protein
MPKNILEGIGGQGPRNILEGLPTGPRNILADIPGGAAKQVGAEPLPPREVPIPPTTFEDPERRFAETLVTPEGQVPVKEFQEATGSLEVPLLDPITVGFGAAGAGATIAYRSGSTLAMAVARGSIEGVLAASADYPIGVVTELVAGNHPEIALPLNLALGVMSGVTLERAVSKKLAKSLSNYGQRQVKDLKDPAVADILEKLKSNIASGPNAKDVKMADEIVETMEKSQPKLIAARESLGLPAPAVRKQLTSGARLMTESENPGVYVEKWEVRPPKGQTSLPPGKEVKLLQQGQPFHIVREFDEELRVQDIMDEEPGIRKFYETLPDPAPEVAPKGPSLEAFKDVDATKTVEEAFAGIANQPKKMATLNELMQEEPRIEKRVNDIIDGALRKELGEEKVSRKVPKLTVSERKIDDMLRRLFLVGNERGALGTGSTKLEVADNVSNILGRRIDYGDIPNLTGDEAEIAQDILIRMERRQEIVDLVGDPNYYKRTAHEVKARLGISDDDFHALKHGVSMRDMNLTAQREFTDTLLRLPGANGKETERNITSLATTFKAIFNRGRLWKEVADSDLIHRDYQPTSFTELPPPVKITINDFTPKEIKRDMTNAEQRLAALRSPHRVMSPFFGELTSPVLDREIKVIEGMRNASNGAKWAKAITKGIPSSASDIKKLLKPQKSINDNLIERLHKHPLYPKHIKMRQRHFDLQARIAKAQEPGASTQARAAIPKMRRDLKIIRARLQKGPISKIIGAMKRNQNDAYDKLIRLAETSPSVRIAMAADGALPEEMLTRMAPDELLRANSINEFMEQTKERLIEVGVPVRKNYGINHMYYDMESIPGITPKYAKFAAKLPHRLGDFNWMPDVPSLLPKYIANVNRTIGDASFLNKWAPVLENIKDSNPAVAKYLNDWMEENFRKSYTKTDLMLNHAMAIEYFKDIAFSLSVGAKHALKTPATLSRQGVIEGLFSLKEQLVDNIKIPVNILRGQRSDIQRLRDGFALQWKTMRRVVDDSPDLRDTLLSHARTLSGYPTLAIESVENGVTVISEALRGKARGLPDNIIRREAINSIFRTNFRGGGDQPLIQKNIYGRALTMFKQTPAKITENVVSVLKDAVTGKPGARLEAARFLMFLGSIELGARMNDRSVVEWMVHVPYLMDSVHAIKDSPFFEFSKQKAKFAASPPLLGTMSKIMEQAADPDFERFIDYELGSFSKYYRTAQGRLGKHYHSELEQLLGIKELE